LADEFGSKPGPIARAANSLIEKGLLRAKTDKNDVTSYSRTAEGGKVAKTLD
jgi:DNA-binding MarR family transcriptional regulator